MKLPPRRLPDVKRKSRPSYIRESLKTSCEICGADENLLVHHLDCNHLNNAVSNLQTLCRGCHYKTHQEQGHFAKERPSIVCSVCGVATNRGTMCRKRAERNRLYGDPLLTKKRLGKQEFILCREN